MQTCFCTLSWLIHLDSCHCSNISFSHYFFPPQLNRSDVIIKWSIPSSFPSQSHCSRETNKLSSDSKAVRGVRVPEGITHSLLFTHASLRLSSLYQLMRPVDPATTLQSSGQHKSKESRDTKPVYSAEGPC